MMGLRAALCTNDSLIVNYKGPAARDSFFRHYPSRMGLHGFPAVILSIA